MGFFSKLQKVVNGVDKGAAIAAATLPGRPGAVAGEVEQTAGVVTAIVQQLHAQSGPAGAGAAAQKDATLVTAVAVDDHEQRLLDMEKTIQELQAKLASQSGQPGQTGQQ